MTSGIGNPDWQRRYDFSAVPLFSFSFDPSTTVLTSLLDANGYTSLIFSLNSAGSTAFNRITIFWYQDAAATVLLSNTDFFPVPNSTMAQKAPVMTRYFKVQATFISGVAGGTEKVTIYGTTSDTQNLLTQNTDQPLLYNNQTIATTVTVTLPLGGMYGGGVVVSMDDNVNNKWTVTADYFDLSTVTWRQFYTAHGPDKGQSWTERISLPYAPVRFNQRNDDTVSHTFILSVIAL